jgi:hypothetical protein
MINLVVALRSEARPLVEHFDMAVITSNSRPRLYEADGLTLAVSGIGKGAAKRAVTVLAARSNRAAGPGESSFGWINLGLAGHRYYEVGEGFLASSVKDAERSGRWDLPKICDALPPAAVMTVEKPEVDYSEDVLYDMEASAFMAAVSSLSRADRVQVLKVVSDNLQHPARMLTATLATELISSQLAAVEELLARMRRLR